MSQIISMHPHIQGAACDLGLPVLGEETIEILGDPHPFAVNSDDQEVFWIGDLSSDFRGDPFQVGMDRLTAGEETGFCGGHGKMGRKQIGRKLVDAFTVSTETSDFLHGNSLMPCPPDDFFSIRSGGS